MSLWEVAVCVHGVIQPLFFLTGMANIMVTLITSEKVLPSMKRRGEGDLLPSSSCLRSSYRKTLHFIFITQMNQAMSLSTAHIIDQTQHRTWHRRPFSGLHMQGKQWDVGCCFGVPVHGAGGRCLRTPSDKKLDICSLQLQLVTSRGQGKWLAFLVHF